MNRRTPVALLLLIAVMAACGGSASGSELPPIDRQGLAAVFDPMLEPMGYHVTRGGLSELSVDGSEQKRQHLGLYVAPNHYASGDEIASDFAGLVRLFIPFVFDEWDGIDSFDICQEPFESTASAGPTLTLLDVSREAARKINWPAIGLEDIVALNHLEGIRLYVRPVIQATDTWPDPTQ